MSAGLKLPKDPAVSSPVNPGTLRVYPSPLPLRLQDDRIREPYRYWRKVVQLFATMKRRGFLSGLLAAPLALKARFLAFFARKPVELCGAAIFDGLLPRISDHYRRTTPKNCLELLAQGKSMEEAAGPLIKIAPRAQQALARRMESFYPVARCPRPRGHKGPHALLFTR